MKSKYKIISLSVLAGIGYWIADAVCDFFFFYEGTFWDLLIFHVPAHEIYMRSAGLGLLVFFGLILSKTLLKLKENEVKLEAVLGAIGDHMSMIDKDLNIIWANKIAKELFGDNIIGKKCYEVYHKRKEPCQPYPCLTLKAFQDGKIHEHDTQVIDKEGKIIYFHCIANVALKDKTGKPAAVIEISRDITQFRHMENELMIKINALNNSINAISFADLEGKVIYVNSSYLKLFGYDNESEVLGKSIFEFSYEKKAVMQTIEIVKNTGGWIGEADGKRKDGSSFDVQISISLLKDENNKPLCTMASFIDITDRKKMENELRIKEHAIATSINGIGLADLEGKVIYVNSSHLKMYGYDNESEILGKSVFEFGFEKKDVMQIDETVNY